MAVTARTSGSFGMFQKLLGSTGVKVPEIGLGTWQYRSGVEPLRRGMALGANLIDTAEIYGTEDVVGEAIKGLREQVLLATKVWSSHLNYEDVLKAADGSLRKLGTSYIDLYQVHWPNPSVPIKETMRAMERLVDEGKVRYIGVSNFSLEDMKHAKAAMEKHRIVANQLHYSLIHRDIEKGLLQYCQDQRVTVIAYSPLERGMLSSTPLLRHKKAMGVLRRIAAEIGNTPSQVALNWCISKPGVIAIPKADIVEHIEEDCKASGWYLSQEHMQALDMAFK